MADKSQSSKTTAETHSATAASRLFASRAFAVWVAIVATGGLATFAWQAAGQDSADAPNTRRFLEQYAAAKQRSQQGPAMAFESIGTGAAAKTPPVSQDAAPSFPPAQSTHNDQPLRVADHSYGPLAQGPSFGPTARAPQQDHSALSAPAAQDNSTNPPGGQLRFAPPAVPSGDPLDVYTNVPAPVGGYGQAGTAALRQQAYDLPPQQQQTPAINQQTMPIPSTHQPVLSGPQPGPQHPVRHYPAQGGIPRYAPFANAGTGHTQPYGQGAYVNPGRTPHVADYRLRVDDVLDCVFRITREESSRPYELNVGDTIRVESISEPKITRELIIQPDGTVSLLLLGQVRATRQTVEQFRRRLEELYREYYRQPDITITPLQVNTKLLDVINTVDSRAGTGGQVREARVAPDGTISLPAVGKIAVQGMTLDEVKREIDARYAVEVQGVEVTPILTQRAQRFVYVVGETQQPGRYELLGPTNVMQAISLAGGWNVGANLRQVIILRRGPDWRVQATMLDVWDALYGNRTCPIDDIWLADSDVVIIPKMKILVADDFVELIFTRGIYGVFPFQGASMNFSKLGTL